jgi:hypothetical protein
MMIVFAHYLSTMGKSSRGLFLSTMLAFNLFFQALMYDVFAVICLPFQSGILLWWGLPQICVARGLFSRPPALMIRRVFGN